MIWSSDIALVAGVLDEAWMALTGAWERGSNPEVIAVSPEAYCAIAEAKAAETRRGAPLCVLGLDLVAACALDGPETMVW
ncbi:MAG: hypothetical protein M0Z47_05145 [Actinomycetota bacterium]|nr:hypothetical protein [Actinomycetota bacterium]